MIILAQTMPNPTIENVDTHALNLKPPGEFMNEVIGYIWPNIMLFASAIIAWKGLMILFSALRGN